MVTAQSHVRVGSTQHARVRTGILCAYGTQNFIVAAAPPVEAACAEGFAL